jgi:hypothetical protein
MFGSPGADQREARETDKRPVVFFLRKVLVLILVLHTCRHSRWPTNGRRRPGECHALWSRRKLFQRARLALHVQAASVSARNLIRLISMIAVATSAYANKAAVELGGVACQTPPPMHCPETGCPADVIAQTGAAVEPNTGRNFFLDYPCDLKAGEKVTFILSLHGAGSIGNWHRHYFPLIDCKDKYRLVVATPTSSIVPNSNPPSHVWNADADDKYLENIVNLVYGRAKGKNIKIKAFWLVGDSLGGATSSRLVRTDFFKDKVDGFLSLLGGRVIPRVRFG